MSRHTDATACPREQEFPSFTEGAPTEGGCDKGNREETQNEKTRELLTMTFDLHSFSWWRPPRLLKSRIRERRRKVGSVIAIKYDEELPFGPREIGVASDC